MVKGIMKYEEMVLILSIILGLSIFGMIFLVKSVVAEINSINLNQSINQSNEKITRTLTSNTICNNGVCKLEASEIPINYLDNGEFKPIDNNLVISDDKNYNYMIKTGIYKTYFKENPSESNPIKVMLETVVDDATITNKNKLDLYLQPYSLVYKNDLGETQLISNVQNVKGYPIQHIFPSEHIRFEALDTMFYPNIFGEGTNLTIEYDNSLLRKRLYVEPKSLPKPTIDSKGLTLDLVFKISSSNGWSKSSLESVNKVPLEINSEVLGFLKSPIATEKFHWIDNNTGRQLGTNSKYSFYNNGSDYFVSIRTNYSFINNPDLISPFEIDPSISVAVTTGGDDSADVGTTIPVFDNTSTSYYPAHSTASLRAIMGVRFLNVTIPQGATISYASLNLSGWRTCSARGGCIIGCYAVASDNTNVWSNSANRPKDATLTTQFGGYSTTGVDTSNGVYTQFACVTGNGVPTTTMANVVENITNRTGWVSGNNLSIVIKQISAGAGNNLMVDTYENVLGAPVPTLYITYIDTSPPIVALVAPSSGSTDTDGNISFQCNATDNSGVNNVSLYTNFTGSWSINSTAVTSQLALNKNAYNSSQSSGFPPSQAVDGNAYSAWFSEPEASLPQWIYVDLGSNYSINRVDILWVDYYEAKNFTIQISNDSITWYNVSNTTGNTAFSTTNTFPTNITRYVKIFGTEYSGIYNALGIFEINVYYANPYTFNINNIANGYYIWNCKALDDSSNSGWGVANFTLTVNVASSNCWTYDSGTKMLFRPVGCTYLCTGDSCLG